MKPWAAVAIAAVMGLGIIGVTQGEQLLFRTELGQRALHSIVRKSAPAGVAMATPGAPLPALHLMSMQGRAIHLPADANGAPMLINLWASWCHPCLEELPLLDAFAREGRAGLRVYGIAIDAPDGVRAQLQRWPLGFPTLLSAHDGNLAAALGNPAGMLPYSVLVARDGRVIRQHLGAFHSASELDHFTRVP